MQTELNVNLEKRTANLLLDYFHFTSENASERSKVISALSDIKDVVVIATGNRVDVAIDFDFGPFIPKEIWDLQNNSLISSFADQSLSQYWNEMCKEAVLECVKRLLPEVLRGIRESAKKLING